MEEKILEILNNIINNISDEVIPQTERDQEYFFKDYISKSKNVY